MLTEPAGRGLAQKFRLLNDHDANSLANVSSYKRSFSTLACALNIGINDQACIFTSAVLPKLKARSLDRDEDQPYGKLI